MWNLSNAFTSAFKELEPIPQYKATASWRGFLHAVRLGERYHLAKNDDMRRWGDFHERENVGRWENFREK
jgi:hypothetical protein